jgi:hypothetical protein
MSLDKIRKSDRFQTMTAVFFMILFAAVFLLVVVPKGNITNFVCTYAGDYDGFAGMCSNQQSPTPEGPGQVVTSQLTSACVDDQGLKVSVAFDIPLTGEARIQIFSTGPDFFPSAQGMTDTYEFNTTIATEVDHLDLIIPVDSMPVGERIFGNIAVSEQGVSSHVAYLIIVSDCSITSVLPPDLTPNEIPIISSATCLPSRQLMIAFEFEGPVLGQYRALVADIPYQLASVVSQPAILFFSGQPPPEGPIVIRLISATDEVVVFEETYTPPVCDAT